MPRHKDGRSYGKTMRDLARALAAKAPLGKVEIRYRHSPLGAQLHMAGLISGSREYAVNEDRGSIQDWIPRARRRLHIPISYSTSVLPMFRCPGPSLGSALWSVSPIPT